MIKKYINSKPDIRLNPTNKPKSPPKDAETSNLDCCNIVMRFIINFIDAMDFSTYRTNYANYNERFDDTEWLPNR